MISLRRLHAWAMVLAVTALVLVPGYADARAGRGGSFGSRGGQTWSAPAPTRTAPSPAQPIQRSATPQPAPGYGQAYPQPGMGQPARPGLFSGGGLLGGLIGAGLLGMLLGYGMFGGMGGLGSILGLLLQVALVVMVVRFALRYFQTRSRPAFAGPAASVPPLRRDIGVGAAPAPAREQVPISQADLDRFERTLAEVQAAYGDRDLAALGRLATPEVARFLADDLAEDARNGVVNHLADVKLLQGDVAESWREQGQEFATVAMRFAARDWTTEQATGRVVEGDPSRPSEATELWTFVRPRGGEWRLAAIQQA